MPWSVEPVFALLSSLHSTDRPARLNEDEFKAALRLGLPSQASQRKFDGKSIELAHVPHPPRSFRFRWYKYPKGFPLKLDHNLVVIDAFVCPAERFQLPARSSNDGTRQHLVLVEACRTEGNCPRYWANIYYLDECEVPAQTLRVQRKESEVNVATPIQLLTLNSNGAVEALPGD